MINKIKHTDSLKDFITDSCEENQISINIEDNIAKTDFLVIKVDRFYSSLSLPGTPPSVDCLVVLKCRDNTFTVYLVELKNIASPSGFNVENVYNKFKTTIDNFMSSRFRNIFLNDRYTIKKVNLYFVTDPYKQQKRSHRREGTKMDSLLSRKPFRFQGQRFLLKHKLPNPQIKSC